MELKSHSFLFVVLLIVTTSFYYQVSAITGDWQPIKNLNSPFILEVGRFAISERNKDGAKLQFVKIVKGEGLVWSGIIYKLILNANDAAVGNAPGNYEVIVWDRPLDNFRLLTSFLKI